MSETAPLTRKIQGNTPAFGAAVDGEVVIGEAPFAGVITGVSYTSNAAVDTADTNTRTISVVNRGQTGAGALVAATLPLVAATPDLVKADERNITPSATPANVAVAEGDVIVFTSTHAASGLADPGGLVQVEIARS